MKLFCKTLAGMLLGALTMVFLPHMAAAALILCGYKKANVRVLAQKDVRILDKIHVDRW